jgi:tetratricopeptide (TPR) repeat protein
MPLLEKTTYDEIIELLLDDTLTGTDDARFTLFTAAFMGVEHKPRIDVRAGTQHIAVARMVRELVNHGDINGKSALWMLLEEAKKYVGLEQVQQIDGFELLINVRDLQLGTYADDTALVYRAGAVSAMLYTDADAVMQRARDGLIGRETLKAEVFADLQRENARLLLQGFSGIGKTALAAEISADWLEEKKRGQVLWLRLGNEEANSAFEALAHPFNASQTVAAAPDANKAQVIRELLRNSPVSLVVLDDVWNGATLMALEGAIPRKAALLVTARQRYALSKIKDELDLTPDDALKLLRNIAGDKLTADENAAQQLCQTLGYLAFAIELAGRRMVADKHPAQKLLADLQAMDVTQLRVPLEYAESGRESVAVLLQTTLDALPTAAQTVFLAWGAFWSTRITVQMLDLYLEQANASSVTVNAENELKELQRYGLATYTDATVDAHGYPLSAAYYRLHDLAYAFAQAQNSTEQRHRALDACLTYTKRHTESTRANFAALEPELANCLGAAAFAMQKARYSDVENFARGLYVDREFHFLYVRGYNAQARDLLQQAANAAARAGRKGNQGAHLGNLGTAYDSLGQYDKAIDYLEQALAIHREIGNQSAVGIGLGNLGIAYDSLGQYDKAIDYHEQALAISRAIGDREGEGRHLNNLGTAYGSLGQYDKAIDYHEQALVISREIGNRSAIGGTLGNLGVSYRDLGQYDKAIEYHEQALVISREIGNRDDEGIHLRNLGVAYESLEDYAGAIQYYEQALVIRRELNVPHLIEETERSLQQARAKLE